MGFNVFFTGLYYKLHGIHRPVTMKKGEIKRRKRVMPSPMADQVHIHVNSNAEQSTFGPTDHLAISEQINELPADTASSSRSHLTGTSSHNAEVDDEQHHPETTQSRGPLPADFTQYKSQGTRPGGEGSQAPSRKRSISATEEISGAPNHPIINAARQAAVVTAIDPSLTDADAMANGDLLISSPHKSSHTHIVMQGSRKSLNSNNHQKAVGVRDLTAKKQKDRKQSEMDDVQRRKVERRHALEAETRRMREALDAKERELLALDKDEIGHD